MPADKDESLLQVNVQGAWASLKFEENRTEFKNLTLLAGSNTYDILCIQFSRTIEFFPLSIRNSYQAFYSFDQFFVEHKFVATVSSYKFL